MGAILCVAVMVGMGFDPDQRIALYCGIPFTVLCFVVYHLTQRVRKNRAARAEHAAPLEASPLEALAGS